MSATLSTADAVLLALAPFDPQRQSDGSYKCNSPYRQGSNSHGFHLTITGPEHGAWTDFITHTHGSLYELATHLKVPLSSQPQPINTKIVYASLAEYAQAHGVPAQAYVDAGWSETTHQGRPALEIPTDSGPRWRYLDGGEPAYKHGAGYRGCWYKLGEALALVNATGQPLVLCNGEPSVVAAQHWGVAATCVAGGGEKKIPDTLLGVLQMAYPAGKPLVVALDSDKTGRRAAGQQRQQLEQAGYVARAVDFRGGTGFDLADFCALHGSASAADLLALPDLGAPPPTAAPAAPAISPNDPRAHIETADIDIPILAQQAWDALVVENDRGATPVLFRRGTSLCRLETNDDGRMLIAAVERKRLRGVLARAAIFTFTRTVRGRQRVSLVEPPGPVLDDLLVNADLRLPRLTRIVQAPVFAGDGSLLTAPGYHSAARTYYDPRPGVTIPDVPERPSEADMRAARALIVDELLADFPFVSDADRAHAVALLLLPFVRELVDGPTPLHLVEAPQAGSGKGLLTDVLLLPALGAPPAPMTEASDDDEWRKRITAALLEGPAALLIDNINATVASGSLAAALTMTEWGDRRLGSSEQVRVPVRCVWVATANNPMLSTEIARRCIRIRIDPKIDKPWERGGFRHANLRDWARTNQGALIGAALTLARYGLQRGQPGRALGSYESWSAVLGRILSACEIPGFLGNLDDLYERADVQSAAWRALASAWWDAHHSQDVAAGDLFDLMESNDVDLGLRGKTERALRTAFGMALAKMADRVLTVDGAHLRIEQRGTGSGSVRLWRLVSVDGPDISRPCRPSRPFPGDPEENIPDPSTHGGAGSEKGPQGLQGLQGSANERSEAERAQRRAASDALHDDGLLSQARIYIAAKNWRKALESAGKLRDAGRRKALEAEIIKAQQDERQ